METKEMTGYPSIDKPWLKYYNEEAIDAPMPEYTLYEYMHKNNKAYPDTIALEYFGTKITYAKFFTMIEHTAKAFRAVGVKPREIVTIVTVSTVTSIVCFYALNRIGAVSNFVNVLSETNELTAYFTEASSRVVVTLDLFAKKTVDASEGTAVETIIAFPMDNDMPHLTKLGYRMKTKSADSSWNTDGRVLLWNSFLKKGELQTELVGRKDPNTLALLTHTGGTTGIPKAVMLSDAAMNYVAESYRRCFLYERGQVWGNIMIPFVVYGLLVCMHMPLSLGLTVSVIPKFDAGQWKTYLTKKRFNYVLGVPSYINPMPDDEALRDVDLSKLYVCGGGGDGLNDDQEQRINAFLAEHHSTTKMLKGYGMSEVGGTAISCQNGINKIGSVGVPFPHNNLMIYDRDSGKELSYNEVGEVCLQTPSRMIGYMGGEDATKELFWIHEDGLEWLHTGDLGYVDEDGFLFLQGRMKRIILTTGDGVAYKVFPNMIEDVLASHADVQQSCVVGKTIGGDQKLKAFVMIDRAKFSEQKRIEEELHAVCEKQLPSHARPAEFSFREELPLTAVGKVDYRQLEEMG